MKKQNKKTKQMGGVKSFTINTKSWGRGAYHNKYGKCCALGFYAKTCGLKPYEAGMYLHTGPLSNIWEKIADANDDLSGQERRKQIRKLFGEAGIRVKFK